MARVKWTSSSGCTRPEWEEHATFAGSQELPDPEGDEGALMWAARLPRGCSLSEWYDREQPLESSRDGWQIDQAALRTIGDHMGVIVAYQRPHLDAHFEARGSLWLNTRAGNLPSWPRRRWPVGSTLVRSGQECWRARASHLASRSEEIQRAIWPRVRSRPTASGPRSTTPALSATQEARWTSVNSPRRSRRT